MRSKMVAAALAGSVLVGGGGALALTVTGAGVPLAASLTAASGDGSTTTAAPDATTSSTSSTASAASTDTSTSTSAAAADTPTTAAPAPETAGPTEADNGSSAAAAATPKATDTRPRKAAGPGGPGGPGRKGPGGELTVAASTIGVSEADLLTALKSGQTVAQVAQSKGVDPQKVIDALVADAKTKIAAAVSAGKITQAEADEHLARVTEHVTRFVTTPPPAKPAGPGGPGGPGRPGGPGGPGGPGQKGPGAELSVAASTIGVSEADLLTALKSGQTVAQVAQSKGVDPQKVIDALVADAKTKIAAAVSAGKMTQAEADECLAHVTEHVTRFVTTPPPEKPARPAPPAPAKQA